MHYTEIILFIELLKKRITKLLVILIFEVMGYSRVDILYYFCLVYKSIRIKTTTSISVSAQKPHQGILCAIVMYRKT